MASKSSRMYPHHISQPCLQPVQPGWNPKPPPCCTHTCSNCHCEISCCMNASSQPVRNFNDVRYRSFHHFNHLNKPANPACPMHGCSSGHYGKAKSRASVAFPPSTEYHAPPDMLSTGNQLYQSASSIMAAYNRDPYINNFQRWASIWVNWFRIISK